MKSRGGRIPAGSALLCCLILCFGVRMDAGPKAAEDQTILWAVDGYTLHQGIHDAQVYWWTLSENWEDTGFLFCAEGILPPENARACLSAGETVPGYLPMQGDIRLRADALYGLCAMNTDYPLKGGILLTQGYWDEEEEDRQKQIIWPYRKENTSGYTLGMDEKNEHLLGLSVDLQLTGKINRGEKDPLKRNETGRWLAENMWRYGFIYQPENETCDGIHLRYVGRSHARMMHIMNMPLEEYLTFLQQQKTVTLMHGATMIACVQCVTEDTEFVAVPQGMRREISRDNRGNIILCFTAEGM